MPSLEEQIREIEEELRKTEYNKKSQHHIGHLKAKMARLREESEKRRSAGGGAGRSYAVKRSGHATVALVGLPNTGKSTLLNTLTNAQSEVADYQFTTLDVVPGTLEYNGAKIQILDLPGIIEGAGKGRGRGREVLSVVRSADLILLVMDAFRPVPALIMQELHAAGLRPNSKPPDVNISKNDRGGIILNATVGLTHLDLTSVRNILNEFKIVNAGVVIREDIDEDRLIDAVTANRLYPAAFIVLTKTDLCPPQVLRESLKKLAGWKVVPVSAMSGTGLETLKAEIYKSLRFIRIYMRPQGGEIDRKEPLVMKAGATVGDVCAAIHRDFRRNFRYAMVWGPSAKFAGQRVGMEHELKDTDALTIVVFRG